VEEIATSVPGENLSGAFCFHRSIATENGECGGVCDADQIFLSMKNYPNVHFSKLEKVLA
jgi:hypothetical protein